MIEWNGNNATSDTSQMGWKLGEFPDSVKVEFTKGEHALLLLREGKTVYMDGNISYEYVHVSFRGAVVLLVFNKPLRK